MSAPAGTDARAAWVARVLGIEVPVAAFSAVAQTVDEAQPLASQLRAQQAAKEIAAGLGAMSMAFRKARLSWGTARGAARASIEKLQAGLRDTLKEDPDFAAMNTAIAGIGAALDGLDDRLDTALDAAMNARDRASQTDLKQQALKIIGEYRTYVDGNTVLTRIDSNPFMPLPVHAVLSGELQAMAAELGAASAPDAKEAA